MNTLTDLRSLLLAGAVSLTLTGCLTQENGKEDGDYASDGQSAFLVSELDQMGQSVDDIDAGLAKQGVTITGELVIDPYSYKEECKCFVRRAKFTTSQGYERIRLDSVVLIDTNGDTLSQFHRKAVAKILHKRHVTKSKGPHEIDVVFDIQVDIKTEGDGKVGIWNGTMSGTYNGQDFKSGTVTNVKRPWENGRFRFPVSGSIEVDRPVFHFLVEFLGDGKAKVTIKNKRNGRIHILFVDVDYKESAGTV